MELKDVILSTLAEMEDTSEPVNNTTKPIQQSTLIKEEEKEVAFEESPTKKSDEMLFLTSMRERLLVLFEGFQAPNNTNIEAKVDMTLNFLEYVLVNIDERVKNIEKGTK